METKKPENIIFKKSHAKSKIVLENLSLMRDPEDKSLLGKDRDDIVILQVMVLERHGALVEYVTEEDYRKFPPLPEIHIDPTTGSIKELSERFRDTEIMPRGWQ